MREILSGRASFILAAMVSLHGCGSEPDPAPVDTSSYAKSEASVDVAEPDRTGPPAIRFTDVTAASGIDFVHHTGAFGQKWMPESLASGCLIFDYDQDGQQDVLFLSGTYWPGHEGEQPAPTSRLYRNLGGPGSV